MTALRNPQRDDIPDPNKAQREASDPAYSVWVGASAGSGKTTILVNRVLRLLLSGVKPQKILCLTFTRAAAAQMSIKIMESLSRWATISDDALRDQLDKLQNMPPEPEQLVRARRLFAIMLACPGGMRIRTIHAFCQEILRRFPIEAGLPPHFTLIEEADARDLLDEAQAALLQEAGSKPQSALGKALRFAVQNLGEYGFQNAMRSCLSDRARITNAIAQAGSLKDLVEQIDELLGITPGETVEGFCKQVVSAPQFPEQDMKRATEMLREGTKLYAGRRERMCQWLARAAVERAIAIEDWCDCFFTDKGDEFSAYGDKRLLDKYPELDALLRREAARLRAAKDRIDALRTAEGTAAVLLLGSELLNRFDGRKKAQALLDYDDLVIRTDKLLRRPGIAPWVLYKLDGGIDHILVDEAQDTSRAQWNIVRSIAEEFFSGLGSNPDTNRTLFVVGDEKQSIFSFQHADPAAFGENRVYFEQQVRDAEKLWREVPMHVSFRSAPAILRAVDAVFANPEVRQGVSHDEVEHYAFKQEKLGRVELWNLIPAAEKTKSAGEWELPLDYEPERDPEAEMAAAIATRIRSWIDSKEKLPGHKRP